MRIISSLILLFLATICHAQDPEYQDYRRKTESFSRVYDKEIRSDLASFTIGGIEESLNKNPLKKIPLAGYDSNTIQFAEKNLRITVSTGIFIPTKHKLIYEGKFLVKIDGKPFYGNYGKIPQTTITAVTVITGADTIRVPQTALFDLYNHVFNSADAVYISGDKRKIYVYMLSKDNAGSYEVTWIIQDNKYLRRILDFGFSKP